MFDVHERKKFRLISKIIVPEKGILVLYITAPQLLLDCLYGRRKGGPWEKN